MLGAGPPWCPRSCPPPPVLSSSFAYSLTKVRSTQTPASCRPLRLDAKLPHRTLLHTTYICRPPSAAHHCIYACSLVHSIYLSPESICVLRRLPLQQEKSPLTGRLGIRPPGPASCLLLCALSFRATHIRPPSTHPRPTPMSRLRRLPFRS